MLYKVTPMMTEPEAKPRAPRIPGQPRKRRKASIFDGEGNEVLITLMCLKCRKMKPLLQFGLRKMADGAIRNQPWCRTCRSGASSSKAKAPAVEAAAAPEAPMEAAPLAAAAPEPEADAHDEPAPDADREVTSPGEAAAAYFAAPTER